MCRGTNFDRTMARRCSRCVQLLSTYASGGCVHCQGASALASSSSDEGYGVTEDHHVVGTVASLDSEVHAGQFGGQRGDTRYVCGATNEKAEERE